MSWGMSSDVPSHDSIPAASTIAVLFGSTVTFHGSRMAKSQTGRSQTKRTRGR